MSDEPAERRGSATRQGELWGAHPRDWAEVQEPVGMPLWHAVLDDTAVAAGTRLLDVGCGAGGALVAAAERGAAVAGLDASAPLLAIARQRLPPADLRVGEMEELPYSEGSFQVVTGFNSFQYAADPTHALREAGRVAEVGAVVAVATWGRPEQCDAADHLAALRPLLPPPPPGAPGPFALSEPGALEGLAERAGCAPSTPQTSSACGSTRTWTQPFAGCSLPGRRPQRCATRARWRFATPSPVLSARTGEMGATTS